MSYNFFGNREDCIIKIQNSINRYSKKEVRDLLPRSEYLSITIKTKHLVTGAKKDMQGKIRFSDEIDPDRLTDYIMEMAEYASDRQLIYACICRSMVSVINEFYSDLNQEGCIEHRCGRGSFVNRGDYDSAFEARKAFAHKRLRGKG